MDFDDEIARRYGHLRFEKHWELAPSTQYTLGSCHAIVDAICQMPLSPAYRAQLLQVSLVKGAQATTAIEGNTLSESEVQRVAEGGTSVAPGKEYQEREVRNVLDAMNAILEDVAVGGQRALITPELVKGFHQAVGRELGEHFDAIPGRFRTDGRVVGSYKCPAPEHVEELVRRLCVWLSTAFGFAAETQTFADAVIQAIVTHVYLEWIHPFGDGNGRTGRLLEFYVLLRAGNPDIASHILSNFYNQTRAEYYRQLANASQSRDLSAFLQYAIQGYFDGLKGVLSVLSESHLEMAWRNLVHARFADRPYRKQSVFKRRRALALALPPNRSLEPDEIIVLTPALARDYGSRSLRTLLRDLDELCDMEIVVREAGKYRINLALLLPQMARHRQRPAAP